jgi:starvation-inducible DNA-binding protein
LKDNNEEGLAPRQMFEDLRADNQQLSRFLRGMHEVCERHNDFATASLIEIWLDEAERRAWFLSEILSDV